MPVSNTSEFILATLASFDPKSKAFRFQRKFPLAVCVDAGKQSSEFGYRLSEIVVRVLSEQGFEIQEFRTEVGSFCQLNLCESRVPLDEPALNEKIKHAQTVVSHALRNFPIKEATSMTGSAVVAVAANPEALTIGSYTVPPSVWVPLLVSKEGRDFLKESMEIFTRGKAFNRALRKAINEAIEEGRGPKKFETQITTHTLLQEPDSKLASARDERIMKLEATLRQVQEELESLKNE